MKILIADDSRSDLAIVAKVLKKLGHEVVGTTSGEHAIGLFREMGIDLVLMNVVMQDMHGFECAKKLREIDSEHWIPIIFLSESVDDEHISQGVDAGCDDYLLKPVSDAALAVKIKVMQRLADIQKKLYETTHALDIVSSTDALTGVANRSQFDKFIKEEILLACRCSEKIALLFLDLDHFKEVNDYLGHHIGDLLLEEVAKRLKACLRENDFLARLGGDEFAIILKKIKVPRDAESVAQKIIDAIKPAYHLYEHTIHITSSIGIACYPADGKTPKKLTQNADIAMYYAKALGRNTFQHYTAEFKTQHKQRFSIESALRFALENNELHMCYQPIFNLQDKKLVGMEALMRWNHPILGAILPDVFIPMAEKNGLITSIGNWALRKVLHQGTAWYKEVNQDFKLTINMSSQQLLQTNLLKTLKKILVETKFPKKLLEIELTESTVMSASKRIEEVIQGISAMKVDISLDDFGTGYSSLNHLKRFNITTLKIDKSFVMDMVQDQNDARIVQSIIFLCKTLKLNLIAEGIETENQLKFLIKNNCQYGQGFYLSEPLSAEAMGKLLCEERQTEKPK